MRRVSRLVFNLATVGSLLLCLLGGGLWIRSYFVSDQIARQSGSSHPNGWRLLRVVTLRGALQFEDFMIADPGPRYYIRFEDTTDWTYDRLEPRSFATWTPPMIPWVLNGGVDWPEVGPVSLWPPASASLYRDRQVHDGVKNSWRGAVIPLWLLVLAMSALPAVRFVLWRRTVRRMRRALHVCLKCRYDLRATPDRCPECGTVPTTQPPRPGGAGG